MKTLILQASPMGTASTLLVNALYGLIPELNNVKIIGEWHTNIEQYFAEVIVLKSHNVNIDELILQYNKYNLFFVCSERKDHNLLINNRFKSYENVCVFDFNELNETASNTVHDIILNIYNKLRPVIHVEMDINAGVRRIMKMNERYEEIKLQPVSYIDEFFQIHGSHRGRTCMIESIDEVDSNMEKYVNTVHLQNKTIHCISTDATVSATLHNGKYWELWMLKYFKRFYKENTNFIDVGGYIGTTTLLMSDLLSPNNKIHVIEPIFTSILLKNIKANSLEDSVIVHSVGLGNQSGIIEIPKIVLSVKKNFGGTSLIGNFPEDLPKMKIPICKLDEIGIDNVSILKIDVENMEINVLEGAIQLITECRPTIFVATHNLNEFKSCNVFFQLINLGYCIREITEGWHDYLLYIPKQTKIPKKIHICQKELAQLQIHSNDWKILNPDYEICLYDDDRCKTMLLNDFSKKHLDLFHFLKDGPIKADFWRMCVLYKYGGVYVDSDVEPLVPINYFLEDDIDFFTCTSYGPNFNPNFIMARPGDEFIKTCIDTYLQMYDSNVEYSYWTYSIMTIFNQLLKLENYVKESGIYYDANGKRHQIAKEIKADHFYNDHNIYKEVRIFNNRYSDYDCLNHRYNVKQKFILICSTGWSGSTTLQRIINSVPNSNITGEKFGAIENLLQCYKNIKSTSKVTPKQNNAFLTSDELDNIHKKPAWYNSYDFDEVKTNIKNTILSILTKTDNAHEYKVLGYREIRWSDHMHLLDEFVELFPNTQIICHIHDDFEKQLKSYIRIGWWNESSEEYLLKYNEKLTNYASTHANCYLSCMKDLFNVKKIKSMFEFLNEPFDEEKYEFIIKNNFE